MPTRNEKLHDRSVTKIHLESRTVMIDFGEGIHRDVKPNNAVDVLAAVTSLEARATVVLAEAEYAAAKQEVAAAISALVPARPSSLILSLLLPADKSDDIIANMEMLYQDRWIPKHGPFWAKVLWWSNSLQFIAWRWAWPITFVLGALKALRPG